MKTIEILKSFGVSVLTYDKYLNDYPNKSTMESIYKEVDILSLHVPLTEETTYLVNEEFIHRFEKEIYLINTSRGKCVNTKHLVSCLENGSIKGACLDVLEYEKTSFEQLSASGFTSNMQYIVESEKTILSPHVAGWTIESNITIAEVLLQKIIADSHQ